MLTYCPTELIGEYLCSSVKTLYFLAWMSGVLIRIHHNHWVSFVSSNFSFPILRLILLRFGDISWELIRLAITQTTAIHCRYPMKHPKIRYWGWRIHRGCLCRGVRPPRPNRCPGYETKRSKGETPVLQGHWGMWKIPSFPLPPGPFWLGMVAPDRALSKS